MSSTLTHIAGIPVARLGASRSLVDYTTAPLTASPNRVDRLDQPPADAGARVQPRAFRVIVQQGQGESLDHGRVKALVDPTRGKRFTLTATRDPDYSGEDVSVAVTNTVRTVEMVEAVAHFELTVEAVDPVWREVDEHTTSRTVSAVSLDLGMPVPVAGHVDVLPTITLKPTALRSSNDGLYGWRYRKQIAVTNPTALDWTRKAVALPLGDTDALNTAGKINADWSDLRIWYQGDDLPRTLMNIDSESTYAWVIVEHLPAGEAMTFEMVYGNSNTETSDNCFCLWYPDKPAFHINGDWGLVSSSTSTVLTALNKSWTTNCFSSGGLIYITSGTGVGQVRRITSNTGNTVTVTDAFTTTPDATSTFYLSGRDRGTATSGTASTLVHSTTAWMTNWWRYAQVEIVGGTGSGQTRTVTSNTSTTLNVTPNWGTNPDATSRYVIRASDNTQRNYLVEQQTIFAGHGLWWMDHWTPVPGVIDQYVPGAWRGVRKLENRDDCNAQTYSTYGSAPIKRIARIEPERWRENEVALTDEGLADGNEFYDPQGITSIYGDFEVINHTDDSTSLAVGKIVMLARSGAEGWEAIWEYTTIQDPGPATIAATTYSMSVPYPTQVYIGVLPLDEIEIPSDAGSNKAQVNNNTIFTVYLNSGGITVGALGTEEQVHDLYSRFRYPPTQTYPPFTVMHVGGSEGSHPSAPVRSGRIVVPLNNNLVINGTLRTVEEWNSTLTAKVGDRLWAVVFERADLLPDDSIFYSAGAAWMPLPPYENPVTNPSFVADATGYTLSLEAGVTGTFQRNTGQFEDDTASGRINVTASSAGAGVKATVRNDDEYPAAEGEPHWFTASVRTTDANVIPRIFIEWYTAADALISQDLAAIWAPAINTWYRRDKVSLAPATTSYFKVGWVWYDDTGSQTGSTYIDNLHVDDPNLLFTLVDTGMTVTVETSRGYF